MKFMKLPIRCLLAVVFAVGAMLVVRAQQSNGTKAAARISGIRFRLDPDGSLSNPARGSVEAPGSRELS